jgi:hypothetical protein
MSFLFMLRCFELRAPAEQQQQIALQNTAWRGLELSRLLNADVAVLLFLVY